MPLPVSPQPDSKLVSATSAAPGAGATVLTLTPPNTPGVYRLNIVTYETGTVDGNQANMQLKSGSTVIGSLSSTGVGVTQFLDRVAVAAGQTFTIIAIGAAGASSVYNASMVATMIDTASVPSDPFVPGK